MDLLQIKEKRLEKLMRHRHCCRVLQHKHLILMLLGIKRTVSNSHRGEPVPRHYPSAQLAPHPPSVPFWSRRAYMAEMTSNTLRGKMGNGVHQTTKVLPVLREIKQVLSFLD